MANEQNLIRNEDRTPEERRENARIAGIASGEARRARKTMRAELEELLSLQTKDENGNPTGKTFQSAITAALIKKALKGNTKAYEIIRDTIGEKPAERIMLAQIDQETIDEVEKMVMEHDA